MTKERKAQLKKDSHESWYQFRVFEKFNAVAAFSSKRFQMNFSEARSDSLVVAHRKHFCQMAEVPFDSLTCLEQVHGANIVKLRTEDAGRGARDQNKAIHASDAALTDSKELTLGIRTADCAPLFYLDPRHHVMGLAHVGWRGASEKLPSKMVQAFRHQYLTKPSELLVALGPMIRECCYQVGPEFKDVFGTFVTKRNGSYYFNLRKWIIDDLMAEGISREKIYDSGFCTSCTKDKFPSYRRDGSSASHIMSVMKLN